MSHPQPPWGQDPHGQQYSYQQPQPGYAPPGGYQPPPRKRHVVRNVILGVAGLVVVIIVAAVVASGGRTPTVSTSPTTSGTGQGAATPAAAVAHVGSTIDLAGNSPGEKMAVTAVQVFPRAQGSDQFNTPNPGNRFYAVQFRLTDNGSIAYSDSPSNGAEVVDSTGQSYQSDLSTVAECQSFPGTENIATGSTGLGCIVFQVPRQAKITEIQFTLDSGFANQTGQWKV